MMKKRSVLKLVIPLASGILFICYILVISPSLKPARAGGPWYVAPDGSNGNDCLSTSSPCATINGAIGKASSGDTIYMATGIYTSDFGSEVVLIGKSLTLSGGWNTGFTTQSGLSTINGQGARRGIYVKGDVAVTIERFTIQNAGQTGQDGGGIYNEWGNLTLLSSNIVNNRASRGGGIFNLFGTLYVLGSTISGNVGDDAGGGIMNNGTTTIINSTVSGNTMGTLGFGGGGGGGGILNINGTLIVNNSTVSGNTILGGFTGSGISSLGGSMMLNNSTIAGNTIMEGVYIFSSAVTLQNTLIANNGSSDCYHDNATITSLGYNLIQNNANCTLASTDLVSLNPMLGPLQINNGSTFTHALMPGSPAINAGNPGGCTDQLGNPLAADQRGFPRLRRCDIGAYELQSIGFSTKTANTNIASPGDPITYTIEVINGGTVNLSNVLVTDTLPSSLVYISNSLTATSGSFGFTNGVITWTGSVDAGGVETITFGAIASPIMLGTDIINTAVISSGGESYARATIVNVPLANIFLPSIANNLCRDFFDDFSNSTSGWAIGEDDFVRSEYLNGEFRVLSKQAGFIYLYSSPSCDREHYTIESDARWEGTPGASYGLIFGILGDFDQFYLFEINTDFHQYDLWRFDTVNGFTIVVAGDSASIASGSATNHLKVTRNGTQIVLQVNGEVLGYYNDGTISGLTGMGLAMSSYEDIPAADARFDNFSVSSLTGLVSSNVLNAVTPSEVERNTPIE